MSMPVRGLAAGVALCALAACTPPGTVGASFGPVEDVGIGLLAPLSGPDAAIGAEQRRGAELAIEVVNDKHRQIPLPLASGAGLPRLKGARLRLSVVDSAGSPDAATVQFDRLITDLRPVAVIGGDRLPVAVAASQRAERLRVPYVDAGSTAAAVTENGSDWYFRTSPDDRMLGEAAFSLFTRVAIAGSPTRRVTLVQPADGRLDDLSVVVQELAAEANVQVVRVVKQGSGGQASAAGQAVGGGAQATVVIANTRNEAVGMTKELRKRNRQQPLIGLGPGFADPAFPGQAGAAANGVLRPMPWSVEFATRNRAAGAVDQLFERRFGAPMSAIAANTFAAVLALATAIDDAAATGPAEVRSALLAADIPGRRLMMPWLGVHFDGGGQNGRAAAVVEQIAGGKVRVVQPAELATGPLAWPGLKPRQPDQNASTG